MSGSVAEGRSVEFGAEAANLGSTAFVFNGIHEPPTRGHDLFRVQFWSGFYETTWAGYGQAQGSSHVTRRP